MSVYAVDFDGTLAETRFPEIIGPRTKTIAAIKLLKSQGHKIILWTSRDGEDLENAVEWCKEQGLVFDSVNAPLPEQIARWGNDTRKIYADVYIDDHAITPDALEKALDEAIEIINEYRKESANT
ncbi:MAG: HAD hydrolase family protein [Acetatifactor sp.]|nr:HAD hydrolase family protein [Acetatifactor sp.]